MRSQSHFISEYTKISKYLRRKGGISLKGEYFIDSRNIDEEIFQGSAEVIAIGSMGCPKAMPDIEEIHRIWEGCSENKKILRIYTPRTPQEHLADMKHYLNNLRELLKKKEVQLVINDMGILLWLKDNHFEIENLVLGATYSWSAMQNTLYENIVRDEADTIKRVYAQVNNNNDLRLEFLRSLNVTEIEVPNIKNVLDQIQRIRAHGFAVSTYRDYMLAGYSRSCVHAKNNDIDAVYCKYECRKPLWLNMKQMWDAVTGSFPYFLDDEEVNQYYSSLIVYGNVQFRKIMEEQKGEEGQLDGEKDTMIMWK